MNLLEVKNISKTYGNGETAVKALKDVSFSVPKGEYVAIVGELPLWALFFCLSRLRQSQLYMLRQNEFAICRLLQPSMNYSFIC